MHSQLYPLRADSIKQLLSQSCYPMATDFSPLPVSMCKSLLLKKKKREEEEWEGEREGESSLTLDTSLSIAKPLKEETSFILNSHLTLSNSLQPPAMKIFKTTNDQGHLIIDLDHDLRALRLGPSRSLVFLGKSA